MSQLRIGLASDVQHRLAELAAEHGHAGSADYVEQIANELLATVLGPAADRVLDGDAVLIPFSIEDVARLLTYDTERQARDGDFSGIEAVEVEDMYDGDDPESVEMLARWRASLAKNVTYETAATLFADVAVDANPYTSTDEAEKLIRAWGTSR